MLTDEDEDREPNLAIAQSTNDRAASVAAARVEFGGDVLAAEEDLVISLTID